MACETLLMAPDVQLLQLLHQNFITCRGFSASSEEKRGGATSAQVRAGSKYRQTLSFRFLSCGPSTLKSFQKNEESGLESLAPPPTIWVSIQLDRKLVTPAGRQTALAALAGLKVAVSSFVCLCHHFCPSSSHWADWWKAS